VFVSVAGSGRAAELLAQLRAERAGSPFLEVRDGEDRLRIIALEPGDLRLWIGRDPSCDVALDWDPLVSRAHVELLRAGQGWAVSDEGMSRNGTFVDGRRVVGRRRLRDGDVLELGASRVRYREPPAGPGATETLKAEGAPASIAVTPAQRRVLTALCRPLVESGPDAAPAGNRAIAEELVVSPETVKTHLRALFELFGLDDVPGSDKRLVLARRATELGLGGRRTPSDPG